MKIDLIDVNPADKVERPKKDRYVGSFYDADEVNALFSRLQREANLNCQFCSARSTVYAGAKQSV